MKSSRVTRAQALAALAFLLAGCHKPAVTPPPRTVDPIHIKAQKDGHAVVIDAYDAGTLFARAGDDLRSGRCESALKSYAILLAEFPKSDLAPLAMYNAALCHGDLGNHAGAASSYESLIEKYPESDDLTDALFQLAGEYEQLEQWPKAVEVFDRIIYERKDLAGIEKVEALARKGAAMMSGGDDEGARMPLEEAARIYRNRRGVSPSDSVYHYSMAQFKLAEILHNQMRSIILPADETLLEAELEKKAQLLLDSQRLYTKVIRIGHAHWASAAAYRIGALYHHLWVDMLNAPAPEDLDPEAQEIYFEILRTRIRVLLKKAVVQWERTMKLAIRLNLDNEWIDSTTKDLEEIRRVLEIEEKAEKP